MLPSLIVVFPHFGRKFAASQTPFFPMDYKQDDIRHPAIGCCGRSFIPINSWDQCHLSFSRCPRLFRLRPIICRWRIAIGKCEKYPQTSGGRNDKRRQTQGNLRIGDSSRSSSRADVAHIADADGYFHDVLVRGPRIPSNVL